MGWPPSPGTRYGPDPGDWFMDWNATQIQPMKFCLNIGEELSFQRVGKLARSNPLADIGYFTTIFKNKQTKTYLNYIGKHKWDMEREITSIVIWTPEPSTVLRVCGQLFTKMATIIPLIPLYIPLCKGTLPLLHWQMESLSPLLEYMSLATYSGKRIINKCDISKYLKGTWALDFAPSLLENLSATRE